MNIRKDIFLHNAILVLLIFFSGLTVKADEIKELNQRIESLEAKVASASEWKSPYTLFHMAGYADVGFIQSEESMDSFNIGTFSPIFHYQYRDIVSLESELEFGVGPDGETESALEYLTINYFLNDYVAVVVGKFLSPLGSFRQNLHPSWINKMGSAPVGFGHDGAAPLSDLGAQVRGGFLISDVKFNYAVYASNGPELVSVTEDSGASYELEGIAAEGFGADRDGKKTYGARIGVLPVPSFELGLSYNTDNTSVTKLEDEVAETESPIAGEEARGYLAVGSDFSWNYRNLVLRGEYIKTTIGEATTGQTLSEEASWEAWYSQVSYRFNPSKWEAALRFTNFDSPHASEDQEQWALSLNYLFANNFIAKVTYESNEGTTGSSSDNNRTIFQLTYGF